MNPEHPILYSFRRCPYAIRARLAVAISGITVELREVILRNKPTQLLNISPKATVPVLLLPDKKVIDESIDIMFLVLSSHDPDHWLADENLEQANQLIQWNDGEFKYFLDRYKYADRYPEHNSQFYRNKAENFSINLETRLSKQNFLCGKTCSLADMAIFPFIRQFANVDYEWFFSKYKYLNLWLERHTASPLFNSIMDKYLAWQPNDKRLYIRNGKQIT